MDDRLSMSLDDIIKDKKIPKKQKEKMAREAERKAARAAKKAEKLRISEEKKEKRLAEEKVAKAESIAKLKREVTLKFNVDVALKGIETVMGKHGEMEHFKKHGPNLVSVRYVNESSVAKALRAKKIVVKIPVPCTPAEIKHHAVYFDAPEAMGEIDDEILKQIENAMGGHGTVVMCKKKGRSIVIFFVDQDTRDGLVSPSSANEVTVEIGDHSVKLCPGLPPNIRQRRNMERKAALKAKKAEALARATGQPCMKRLKTE